MSAQRRSADDFLAALAEADVEEIFRQLPIADQQKFTHWVTQTQDDESRWRRINALVLALRSGPLGSSVAPEPVDHPAARG